MMVVFGIWCSWWWWDALTLLLLLFCLKTQAKALEEAAAAAATAKKGKKGKKGAVEEEVEEVKPESSDPDHPVQDGHFLWETIYPQGKQGSFLCGAG
jgi:hypothetical protein